MKLSRIAAYLLAILAGALIVAGMAGFDWRAGLITAGVLLLVGLFGPNVE